MAKRKDIKGKTYGLLTVKEYAHSKIGIEYWLCNCECGNEHTVDGKSLKVGHTKSCGCLRGSKRGKVITIDLTLMIF